MNDILPLLLAAAGGYLLGSLPFAVIVSRLFGLADPRSFGSGNPGATNVLRSGNKLAAALTLIGDATKGWLAMFIATKVSAGEMAVAVAGVAAFLGHVFPFTLGFQGGKGVATALGVMLAFSPAFGGLIALCWLGVAIVSRYSSLASLVSGVAAPLVAWFGWQNLVMSIAMLLIGVVLVARHQANISKLLAGTESRIGDKTRQ